MGNRAVITLNRKSCIYLHWNGGRDTVDPALNTCKELVKEYKLKDRDPLAVFHLAVSRVAIGPAVKFGDINKTVYVEAYDKADKDNHDNGVYFINSAFEIVGREFEPSEEQRGHDEKYMQGYFLGAIDALGPDFVKSYLDEAEKALGAIAPPAPVIPHGVNLYNDPNLSIRDCRAHIAEYQELLLKADFSAKDKGRIYKGIGLMYKKISLLEAEHNSPMDPMDDLRAIKVQS